MLHALNIGYCISSFANDLFIFILTFIIALTKCSAFLYSIFSLLFSLFFPFILLNTLNHS